MTLLAAGAKAPDFTLATDTRGNIRLSDFAGKRVVLFFYPADNTPGCTSENCEFTGLQAGFDAEGVVLIGLSPNTVASHAGFREKYGLTPILAADPDKVAATAYGAWGLKKNYGKEYMGLIRSSFVVEPDGAIGQSWKVARAAGHAQKVFDWIKANPAKA